MAWYLRTIRGGTDGVAYETLDLVMEQVRSVSHMQTRRGHKAVNEGGRVSFYDGHDLIDTLWVEAEDGSAVPVP